MKTRKLISLLLSAVMLLSVAAFVSACAPAVPFEVEGANTSVKLDLYGAGKNTKEITVSDYINENEAKDITYAATKSGSGSNRIELSAISNGKFTVTGVSVGSADVKLEANQGEEVKVTVTLKITVEDTTPKATVSGVTDGLGYKMTGQSSVIIGESYEFTIEREYGYTGTPTIAYTMNGTTGAVLTPVVTGAKYVYTIVSVTGNIAVTSITGFAADVLDPSYTLALSSGFFDVAKWSNNLFGSTWDSQAVDAGGVVAVDGEGLKFTEANKIFNTGVTNSLVANNSGNWPKEDGSAVGPYQYSFNMKTSGPFKLSLLGNGNEMSNEVRIVFDGTDFKFNRSVGVQPNSPSAIYGVAAAADYGFAVDKEHRIDLVISAEKKRIAGTGTAGTLENDTAAQVNGVIKIQFFIDGKIVKFAGGWSVGNLQTVTNNGLDEGNHANHAFRFDNGDIYVQRLNGVSSTRYGPNFSINTQGATDGAGSVFSVYPAKPKA